MEIPLVSVIMPTYNSSKYIETAIHSVLIQEVPLELIIIDDCSTDNTSNLLMKYKNNHNIIYIKNEENLGVARSRNKGVGLAKGKYIAFLDADDYWSPHKLSKQLDALEAKQRVLCSTARELMTPDGKLTEKIIPVPENITYHMMLGQNLINCSSVILLRKVALEFPMEYEDSHEDYIMWLRVLQKYKKVCAVNEPLLKYRLSNSGKSGSKLHSAKMTFKVYRYMGFGIIKSCTCFVSYALHGFLKYRKH
ncbi:teichuronic acid biosynthesis glycosyltransferase TuaG [Lachnotalea glycerini]|uniref:Glycosyltransferase n=1 Tax=Lachnotalea glycerini TaxID=1763509 RepID=A0A255ISE3_9FIRM|nr:glycosyltransferase [Lachnotalea glycerini]OYO42965.1 glycosyl transferase family 2 [Lachnotalea glycerini]PXV87273.1 teichuronic acid biosynthesis glycosyltransferase TuaG [Lachnotalea glycerini]RDY31679.1 glycosyltransferase [Lachnotalea glycerini]